MDGSLFSPADLEALTEKYIDEIMEDGTTDQINQVLDVLERFHGCECGCRGASHMQEVWEILQQLNRLRSQINSSAQIPEAVSPV